MGRDRTKGLTPSPFSSWEAFDAAIGAEHRRYSDALQRLTLKYGSTRHFSLRLARRAGVFEGIAKDTRQGRRSLAFFYARIDAKFEMEERHHEAIVAKIEARKPEGPWPEHLKAQENPDGGFAALGGGA